MSTTHMIKDLSKLSIASQPIPVPGGTKWGIKAIVFNAALGKEEEHFENISLHETSLSVNYDSTKDEYQVVVDDQATIPPKPLVHLKLTAPLGKVSYNFNKAPNKQASIIVIEDITIHLGAVRGDFELHQEVLTMRISPTPNGNLDEFDHEFWYKPQ